MVQDGAVTVDDLQCAVVKDVDRVKYQRQILLCQMGAVGTSQQFQTFAGKFDGLHILCIQQLGAAGIKDPIGEPGQHDHGQHGKAKGTYDDLGFQMMVHGIASFAMDHI